MHCALGLMEASGVSQELPALHYANLVLMPMQWLADGAGCIGIHSMILHAAGYACCCMRIATRWCHCCAFARDCIDCGRTRLSMKRVDESRRGRYRLPRSPCCDLPCAAVPAVRPSAWRHDLQRGLEWAVTRSSHALQHGICTSRFHQESVITPTLAQPTEPRRWRCHPRQQPSIWIAAFSSCASTASSSSSSTAETANLAVRTGHIATRTCSREH